MRLLCTFCTSWAPPGTAHGHSCSEVVSRDSVAFSGRCPLPHARRSSSVLGTRTGRKSSSWKPRPGPSVDGYSRAVAHVNQLDKTKANGRYRRRAGAAGLGVDGRDDGGTSRTIEGWRGSSTQLGRSDRHGRGRIIVSVATRHMYTNMAQLVPLPTVTFGREKGRLEIKSGGAGW